MANIRLPITEFNRKDADTVDGKGFCHPAFEGLWLGDENILSFEGIEIYPGRRKVYHDGGEIELMAKEFDLLYLLVVNKGYVFTYAQVYADIPFP